MAAVPYIHNVGKQVQKLQNSTLMDRNSRKWYTVQKNIGGATMNIKLTLGERLKDLRVERNLKLNDTYYYCFGCGANGDAIDLTAKLFDLNPRQAAEKLASDFGLDPDKPPANAIALPPPKRGLTDEQWADIAYCLRVLTDYLDLLHDWRERYKPATPEEPHDPRFEEALHMTETIEHLTDCVAFGTPQQKAAAAAQLLSGSYLLMLEERTDRLALAKCA